MLLGDDGLPLLVLPTGVAGVGVGVVVDDDDVVALGLRVVVGGVTTVGVHVNDVPHVVTVDVVNCGAQILLTLP